MKQQLLEHIQRKKKIAILPEILSTLKACRVGPTDDIG